MIPKDGYSLDIAYMSRLSGPFIFFTIIMMIKSSLAWIVIFDDIPVWKPLLTELQLIWIGFCLIEWFAAKRRMWILIESVASCPIIVIT